MGRKVSMDDICCPIMFDSEVHSKNAFSKK